MPHVKVRAEFWANLEDSRVTTYIWFLCNGHGGPGHFVQAGIGRRHVGRGPAANGIPPIPQDVMARLQSGFDHWFNWAPVSLDGNFQEQVRRIPTPQPTFIPTLRLVTADHQSFPAFETLISQLNQPSAIQITSQAALTAPPQEGPRTSDLTPAIMEADLENLRREQTEPSSQGYVYLINMENTAFYKIGMSLDPETRLRTLQTGNPQPLHIINKQVVRDMRAAESGLHQRFAARRVPTLSATEWFHLSDGVKDVEAAFRVL